jgi:hypothetical protein
MIDWTEFRRDLSEKMGEVIEQARQRRLAAEKKPSSEQLKPFDPEAWAAWLAAGGKSRP